MVTHSSLRGYMQACVGKDWVRMDIEAAPPPPPPPPPSPPPRSVGSFVCDSSVAHRSRGFTLVVR